MTLMLLGERAGGWIHAVDTSQPGVQKVAWQMQRVIEDIYARYEEGPLPTGNQDARNFVEACFNLELAEGSSIPTEKYNEIVQAIGDASIGKYDGILSLINEEKEALRGDSNDRVLDNLIASIKLG